MIYCVPVRFSGRIEYKIKADTEEEAMAKANELAEDADCGSLEDIDWDVKSPNAAWDDDSQG